MAIPVCVTGYIKRGGKTMKKVLGVVVAMMCLVSIAGAGMIVPRVGLDFAGNHEMEQGSYSEDYDTKMGFSLGAEYLSPATDKFLLGGGFKYNLNRKIDGYDAAFGFSPLYVTGMYVMKSSAQTIWPYAKVNLGYNILFTGNDDYKGPASLKGGLYYGAGIGAIIQKNIFVDLMYSSYAGQMEFAGTQVDVTDTHFGMTVGYAFDLK